MKIWSASCLNWIPFLSLFLLIGVLATEKTKAQSAAPAFIESEALFSDTDLSFSRTDSVLRRYPDPKKVLRRSMIIPGWGQITNKQVWKVPIVYGLLGGLIYYSTYLTRTYHDYRAAYYNVINGADSDFRFGATPSYIQSTNTTLLRARRNQFRNRRDFIYVGIFLAYALNAVDAYVYAHLRNFDVSDDLTMKAGLKPQIFYAAGEPVMGMSLSLNLFKSK
jgi:hypothetical protein